MIVLSELWRFKYCSNCYYPERRFITMWDKKEYCPFCNALMVLVLKDNVGKKSNGNKVMVEKK